jgi:hypothetical protein
MSNWLPIETAPKDGTYVLLCFLQKYMTSDGGSDYHWKAIISAWSGNVWYDINYGKGWEDIPMYWIPIPPFPDER